MDGEGGDIQGPVAMDDLTPLVDEQEVLHADVREAHPEGIHPEVVEQLGVARGDVTRHPFVETELAEQSERRREALFAVSSFVLDVVELREPRGLAI